MPMISSFANPQIKRVRRLQSNKRFRYQEKVFVVEGTRMIQDLAAGFARSQTVYFTEIWLADPANEALLENTDLKQELVTGEVMGSMSSTETPPGVLATVLMDPLPLPEVSQLILILDALSTPGNMGTMLRTAGAAPVDAVLLAPGCVDIYNPKVIRAAMGAHFRLPFVNLDWPEIAAYCNRTNIWLSEASGDNIYTEIDWRRPSSLIVGNEAQGASGEARNVAHGSLYIPMARTTESLNAAAAAAVILFEAARQRAFPTNQGRSSIN
jgi:TrmH family RNA methyltransferase